MPQDFYESWDEFNRQVAENKIRRAAEARRETRLMIFGMTFFVVSMVILMFYMANDKGLDGQSSDSAVAVVSAPR